MPFENDVEMQEIELPELPTSLPILICGHWSARNMFPPRSTTIDPEGNLMVAIYSRERLVEKLRQRVREYPDNQEFQYSLNVNLLRLQSGEDTYVCVDDYFYDVLDNVNIIARYDHAESPETTLVVGQRIMTWDEFRNTTTRQNIPSTFVEFQQLISELSQQLYLNN